MSSENILSKSNVIGSLKIYVARNQQHRKSAISSLGAFRGASGMLKIASSKQHQQPQSVAMRESAGPRA
jgi:hypothetical protein